MKIFVDEKYRLVDSATGNLVYIMPSNICHTRAVTIFDAFNLYPKFHNYVIEHCGLPYDENHKIPFSSIPGELELKISTLSNILIRTSLAIRELEIEE